ncbi:ABC transporter ATP-binding protein [Nocardioides luteus]|uniref:Multidrug ABC transporter permease n=1 Tax=Nocardioides luteus TaxID=1844 RepID=A0A1J4N648_9ACTN|nr:ABC transporter ATP-binding protein [Nocardioides luteus]OIJ26989.1 multidrug ABC transporter permease [Nocardioides luteus]
MRRLPLDDPGVADHRSPGRFLWWMAKGQWDTLLGGMFFGIVWMSAQAVMPLVIGRAIDEGVATKDVPTLTAYAAVLLGVGLVQAVAGIMRHRFAVTNWLTAAYRVVQLVTRQSVRLGASLPRKVSTGEVAAIGTSDLSHVGQVMDVSARFSGAVVSFVVVAVVLLQTSVTLGLVVLIGVPLVVLLVGPLLSPLQKVAADQRQLMGELSNTAADIVGGLRVLRGIGGEEVFGARYRRQSQDVRHAGVRVARLQSVLDAMQILLPGLFVVAVVWLGARMAVAGEITAGQLVALYGYAAFLMLPLRTVVEYANKFIRARVSAKRIITVLAQDPDNVSLDSPLPMPPAGSELRDVASKVRIEPGRLTALVSEQPDETSHLADRLGLMSPPNELTDRSVTLGGVPLCDLPLADVRRRIVVSDTGTQLFSGPLGEVLDVTGRAGRAGTEAAMHTASAEDILEALPEGYRAQVTERGRSLSGGQRQRLMLARVLTLDPEILILVEPTSAVDAHTEARIASRLSAHRAGRTTVVTTTSPLLLDAADVVVFLEDGKVAATGTHHELLRSCPGYRRVVVRDVEEEVTS